MILALLGIFFVLVGLPTFLLWRAVAVLPYNRPERFLSRFANGKQKPRKVIVCAGDSLTHGSMSANYVEQLAAECKEEGTEFINAGVNSQVAFELLKRLDEIIACQPDVVTILIGTNDANFMHNKLLQEVELPKKSLPEELSEKWYHDVITTIVKRLKKETRSEIALLSLPPIGEDLEHPVNQTVKTFNRALVQIAKQESVHYLPLGEKISEILKNEVPMTPRYPYEKTAQAILFGMILRHLLFFSYNSISRHFGFSMTTDFLHLNEKGGALIADLVGTFLWKQPRRSQSSKQDSEGVNLLEASSEIGVPNMENLDFENAFCSEVLGPGRTSSTD